MNGYTVEYKKPFGFIGAVLLLWWLMSFVVTTAFAVFLFVAGIYTYNSVDMIVNVLAFLISISTFVFIALPCLGKVCFYCVGLIRWKRPTYQYFVT